ncbi:hypothetical protein Dda_5512 [Drechslerella dactyloides]|uniref:Sulfhydryl oxidase n=1 Tax=Drechslerella dactyloides TaxID=74499 RepID=A0AAD6NKA8_DREDA|nr:hypothetical protein Dda_5512 [Drechslerella dactyloides]
MARNKPVTYIAFLAVFIFLYSYLVFPSSSSRASPFSSPAEQGTSKATEHRGRFGKSSSSGGDGGGFIGGIAGALHVSKETIQGGVIMPKLGNETIKAELGRASWRLLHTMLARFPEKPTTDEREALKSYIHLFARLYPCGECADHFRLLLEQYPPQTSSRDAASQWGCVVHNAVNKRLNKDIFDCGTIADKYHCGCAEEDEKKRKQEAEAELVKGTKDGKKKQKVVEEGEMKLVKEGLTRGG